MVSPLLFAGLLAGCVEGCAPVLLAEAPSAQVELPAPPDAEDELAVPAEEGGFNDWLRAGVGLLRHGRPQAALESLERASELADHEPQRLTALAFRALVLVRLGRAEAALAQSDALQSRPAAGMEELAPRPALAVALLARGFAQAELDRPEQAERALGEALEKYAAEAGLEDWFAEAWLLRGALRVRLGKLEEALQDYRQAARAPSPPWEQDERRHLLIGRALRERARTLSRLGRREEQLEVLEQLMRRYAGSSSPALRLLTARAALQRSEALEAGGELAQAVQALEELAEGVERDGPQEARDLAARARLRQGWLLRRLQRGGEALEVYSVLAERYGPGADSALRRLSVEARVQRAAALLEMERPEAARETLEEAAELYGADPAGGLRAHAVRALLLHAQLEADPEARLAALERVQEQYGEDTAPQVQEQLLELVEARAGILAAEQRLSEALQILEQEAARRAESAEVAERLAAARLWLGRSLLLEQAGRQQEALQVLDRAHQVIGAADSGAQAGLLLRLQVRKGLLLYRMQQWEWVIKTLDPLLRKPPESMDEETRAALAEAWLHRNIAVAIVGRLREADLSLERMIGRFLLDPAPGVKQQVLLAHLHRSQLQLQLEQPGKGLRILAAALERYGEERHSLLGRTLAELRLERAILLARGDQAAGLGAFQELAERYAEAEEPVLRSQGAAALLGSARLLSSAGQLPEARRQAGRAVQILREIDSPFLDEAEQVLRGLSAAEQEPQGAN